MKHTLIGLGALLLAACATVPSPSPAPMAAASTGSWATLAGDYDNHAQVWQAQQSKAPLPPQHVHYRIRALDASSWQWDVAMQGAKKPLHATWRYSLRVLADGRRMLTPQRKLSAAAKDAPSQWAPLAACALTGSVAHGVLSMRADVAACSAMLPGLGAAAAMLPIRFNFDGNSLKIATFADQARGKDAVEVARRVRWFDGWVAINGAGPKARADSKDWHVHHNLRLGDQGGHAPILWRDGKPSGYSLLLERLTMRARHIQVLKLSLVRDSDGATVAYAWANPQATRIGLNLGWVQAGLSIAGTTPAKP